MGGPEHTSAPYDAPLHFALADVSGLAALDPAHRALYERALLPAGG